MHMFTELVQSMFEALRHPQQKHAMVVHFPIAISVLGLLGLVALAVKAGRPGALRWGCVGVYLLGAVLAYVAEESGEAAMDRLDTVVMSEAALEHLEAHEEMGGWVWIILLTTAALIALTAVHTKKTLRLSVLTLAVLSGVIAAGYIAVTAHHGGTMVYQHGVGIPASPNNLGTDQTH